MADNKTDVEKEREKVVRSLEANLNNTFYGELYDTNTLRQNPLYFGELGHRAGQTAYETLMTGDDAGELRKKLYEQEMEVRKQLGIADQPSYPDNYQVSKHGIALINEALVNLPLGSLEKVVGKIAEGAKFEIPEELKKYSGLEEELDDKTRKVVLDYKNALGLAFKRGGALRLSNKYAYADVNAEFERIDKAAGKLQEKKK